MMKRMSIGILFLLTVSAVWAGMAPSYLPASSHYQGRNSFYVNEGSGVVQGHVEFAVYDTQTQSLAGYDRQERYVYAYQVFSYSSSTAALTYFSLLGANFSGLTMGSSSTLSGAASGGVSPTGTRLEDSNTKAIWDFANGALVKGERSWFLVLYSNSDWVKGDYEVKSTYNDDLPVPEPLTLALLAVGGVLSVRRKRK